MTRYPAKVGLSGVGDILVAPSASDTNNTGNLWLSLIPDAAYTLRLTPAGIPAFDWDYALAWNIQAVPLPTMARLVALGLMVLRSHRRRPTLPV